MRSDPFRESISDVGAYECLRWVGQGSWDYQCGCYRDLTNDVTVSKFYSSFTLIKAARCRWSSSVTTEVGSSNADAEGAYKRATDIWCD